MIKHQEKTPSPRSGHMYSGWEYAGKLWTFGGTGPSPDGYLNEHGHFQDVFDNNNVFNNQLLCFDPSRQEWTDINTSGTMPEPRITHAATITRGKVWLYGGLVKISSDVCNVSDELYQLNMVSLIWTEILTGEVKPGKISFCSFNASTDNKLVLHGGLGSLSHLTWVFDVPSLTWNHKDGDNRYHHKGTEGVNGSVVVIGGLCSGTWEYQQYRTISVKREPKSLQELSTKIIYDHRDTLPWRSLPNRLVTQIMCPGIAVDSDVSTEQA